MKYELQYLGMDAEHSDWAVFKYGGYHLTLHLTVMGGTRVRLIENRDDPVCYHLICDWCLGNEDFFIDIFSVLFLLYFMKRIDANDFRNLPYRSKIKPVFNDLDFCRWSKIQDVSFDEAEYKKLSILLKENDRRKELINSIYGIR